MIFLYLCTRFVVKMKSKFRRYLRLQKGLSSNTLEAYMHDVSLLYTWVVEKFGQEENIEGRVQKLTLADLEEFSASLFDLGIAPSSHARILCGIRAFYKFLEIDGFIDQDPSELLEAPIQAKHLPEVLSTEEVDMLKGADHQQKPF